MVRFDKESFIKDLDSGFSYKKLGDKYGMSKSKAGSIVRNLGLKSKNVFNTNTVGDPLSGVQVCTTCNNEKPLDEYFIRSGKNIHHRICKVCKRKLDNKTVKEKKKRIKDFIFNILGKKCQICDFEGHYSIMEVHHVDATKKEIAFAKYCTMNFEKIKEEFNNAKCVLLCSCCHRETHSGLHPDYIENEKTHHIADEVELDNSSKKCTDCNKVYPKSLYTDRNHCISCQNMRKRNRKKVFKKKCIDYLNPSGKCCVKCGYKKYIGALDFHHKDPNKKDFGISNTPTLRLSDIVKNELDKCVLLCSNCHRYEHHVIGIP